MEAGETRTFDVAAYLQAGVSDPDPTIVVRAEHRQLRGARDRRRQQADADRRQGGARREGRGPARRQRRLLVEPAGRAPGRGPDPVPGHRRPLAAGRAAPLPGLGRGRHGQDVVGSRRTTTAERRSSTTRSRRSGRAPRRSARPTSASSASSRTAATTTSGCAPFNRVGPSEYSDLSSQARADTEPGRVQNIRMKSQGDGQITIAWDKPSIGGTRILDYTITWVGGQAVVPGDQLSYPASGLNNNEKYVFTIKAQNKAGFSAPRASAEFQPLGTPPAPPAPTVTDLEAGANQTNLRIALAGRPARGPGPDGLHRLLHQRRPLGLRPGLPEARLPHLHPPGRALRRADLHLHASWPPTSPATGRGRARARRSRPSAARRSGARSARRPRAPARRSSSSTRCRTPAARPARSRSSSEASSTGPSTSRPGSITTRIQVPSNEQAYPVQLRVCNEKAPGGLHAERAAERPVLRSPRRHARRPRSSPVVNGSDVTWTVTGSSNGDAAQLYYRIDGGAEQVIDLAGTGSFSQPITATTGRLRPGRSGSRCGSGTRRPAAAARTTTSDTAQSGVPDPTITVLDRPDEGKCTDGDGDGGNNCCRRLHPARVRRVAAASSGSGRASFHDEFSARSTTPAPGGSSKSRMPTTPAPPTTGVAGQESELVLPRRAPTVRCTARPTPATTVASPRAPTGARDAALDRPTRTHRTTGAPA